MGESRVKVKPKKQFHGWEGVGVGLTSSALEAGRIVMRGKGSKVEYHEMFGRQMMSLPGAEHSVGAKTTRQGLYSQGF